MDLSAIIDLSQRYGSDPDFVLAGGGNTSFKTDDTLWVKASGVGLADIGEQGFVQMDRPLLSALLDTELGDNPSLREERFKALIMAARTHPEKGLRPSVECSLHNLLPAKYVVHTHPTWVNMVLCCTRAQGLAKEVFGDDALWVGYTDPGYVLARKLQEAMSAQGDRPVKVVLMGNHGLIVCGDSPEEIERTTAEVDAQARAIVGDLAYGPSPDPSQSGRADEVVLTVAPALRALLAEGGRNKVVCFDDSPVALDLVTSPEGRDRAMAGPLTPDQVVYCRSFPLWFEPKPATSTSETIAELRELIAEHERRHRSQPRIVLAKGVGLFAIGKDRASARTARDLYTQALAITKGAAKLGGVRPLTQAEHEFIDNWEVENYRRTVAAGAHRSGRAAGKTVLVTGGAQGFGLGIAEDFVREGGHAILADLNADGAQKAAASLGAEAVGVALDVTDGDSVRRGMAAAVREMGGFDVLVSNAGVLKAESVKTQSLKDFEFVTKVNYIGFFLCAQHGTPILAIPRLVDPDSWTDIIQINSKSGLQGSNRNGAYAGSKFGSIGLVQSFAMELLEDGIKVNAICPGNFFEGPLWSDPDTGLFAQYLRTGKVPGAQTIEDVKRFYEAKVPMGRGCSVADVMKALYYLVDQQYETGQALPVTGGQVMLR